MNKLFDQAKWFPVVFLPFFSPDLLPTQLPVEEFRLKPTRAMSQICAEESPFGEMFLLIPAGHFRVMKALRKLRPMKIVCFPSGRRQRLYSACMRANSG